MRACCGIGLEWRTLQLVDFRGRRLSDFRGMRYVSFGSGLRLWLLRGIRLLPCLVSRGWDIWHFRIFVLIRFVDVFCRFDLGVWFRGRLTLSLLGDTAGQRTVRSSLAFGGSLFGSCRVLLACPFFLCSCGLRAASTGPVGLMTRCITILVVCVLCLDTGRGRLLDRSCRQVQSRKTLAFASFFLGEQHLPLFVGARDTHPIEGRDGVLNGLLSVFLRRVGEIPHIKILVGFVFEVEFVPIVSVFNTILLGQGRAVIERGAGHAGEEFDGDSADGKEVNEGDLEGIEANSIFILCRGGGSRSEGRDRGGGTGDA